MNPVFGELNNQLGSRIVGYMQSVVHWDQYLTELQPEGVSGIVLVLQNTCGQAFTYSLDGSKVRER
jgi:hypothetical protein